MRQYAKQAAFAIDHVEAGAVVHAVMCFRALADELVAYTIAFCDLLQLFGVTSQPCQVRMKKTGIFVQMLGGIAIRVEGDEQGVDLVSIFADAVQSGADRGQSRRADIRAEGIAERHHYYFAARVLKGIGRAIVGSQCEIATQRKNASAQRGQQDKNPCFQSFSCP